MARFLLIIDRYLGHVHASLGLARRLAAAGDEVCYLGCRLTGDMLRPFAVPFREAAWLDLGAVHAIAARPGSRSARRLALRHHLAEAREATAALVGDWRPDLVVFDPFLLGFYPLFWEHKVPAVALSTKPLLTFDRDVPPYTRHTLPGRSPAGQAAVLAAWGEQLAAYGWYRGRSWLAERLRGMSPRQVHVVASELCGFPLRREWRTRPVAFDLRFASVPEIVLHAAEFDFPRRRPDPHARYIGPCLESSRELPATTWTAPPGAAPLIYCSLGTVRKAAFEETVDFYRNVIAATRRDPPLRLVIATGQEAITVRLLAGLGDGSKDCQVVTWAPQLQVLSQAAALITHGGANSIKEAVAAGVPMLVYPRRADQPGNAARVVFHGLGLRGRIRQDTPASLRSKLDRLLHEPAFAARVAGLRQDFRRYDEDDTAVRLLHRLIAPGHSAR